MHIKRIHEMIEKLTEVANSQFAKGIDTVDAEEMKEVACMINELAEAEYYSKISKAMDEVGNEETMDRYEYYNDDMRYYRGQPRDSRGRFTSRRRNYTPTPYYYDDGRMYADYYRDWDNMSENERMRDMDRASKGRMYYTENLDTEHNHNKSKVQEAKERYKSNKTIENAKNYIDVVKDELTELWSDMPADHRTSVKTALNAFMTRI